MKGKLWNAIGSGVGTLVLIGLTVLLSLTLSRRTTPRELTVTPLALQTAAHTPTSGAFDSPLPMPTESHREQTSAATSTPIKPREERKPTATPTPDIVFESPLQTPTPTPTPGKPTPTVPVPDLEDYVFGEPQVVLTHTAGIGIARWLPDGERLLIVRTIPGKPREYVETFNVRTGELQRYGERLSMPIKPVWLDEPGKVAFADTADRRYDLYNLWISGYDQERGVEATLADVNYPMAGKGNVVWIVPSSLSEK